MKQIRTIKRMRTELRKQVPKESDWTQLRILKGQIAVLDWILDGKELG